MPLWNAVVCWRRCRDSQTERPGGITSTCPGQRNLTSCNHPSEFPLRPVGKMDRQLTDLPTPTRRKNRHDKDRMIYLTKREIEKEFHTPRFAKGGQRLWCVASRGNHRRSNRYDGGSTGKNGTPILVDSRIPIPPAAAGPLALCRQRRKVS